MQRLQDASASGGFRKSLTYAFGEILLIVVGILLALQIDQWNQARIETEKEQEYLHNILADLQSDLASIDSALAFNADKVAKIIALTEVLADTSEPLGGLVGGRLGALMPTIASYARHMPRSVSFGNMVSAESIGLIRNPVLRMELAAYYAGESPYVQTQDRVAQVTRELSTFMARSMIEGGPADLFFTGEVIDLPLPVGRGEAVRTDPETYASLFELQVVTDTHSQMLAEEKAIALALVDGITADLARGTVSPP